MSANFRNGSATGSGRSSASAREVTSRPRSPSPYKNSVSDECAGATVRSRSPVSPVKGTSRSPRQSIIDTAQQTVKETMTHKYLENILNTDKVVRFESNAELKLYEKHKVSKKMESPQVSPRESSSGRRKLVSNYSKNKMNPSSKKGNSEEDTASKEKTNDPENITASGSSLYLNSFEAVNSIPSLCCINVSDVTTQKGKEIMQNNCKKYMKLIDDLCDRIMEDSDSITLMQVSELLTQLKWKLLNYDRKVRKPTTSNEVSDSNTVLNKDSLIAVMPSFESDAPNDNQLEQDCCQVKLNVSPKLSETNNNNNNGVVKCKFPKSKFPNKDTVKFAGIMKLDTSAWNSKNKQRALLNIGTSKEIKFSNLEVDTSKKDNDKRKERRNEKLSILRSQKPKPDEKDTGQSAQKKSKISDERRLDDRSMEKGLNESRSPNKERKQTRESGRRETPCASRDHKDILTQVKKSFKEYVENAKDKENKKNVKQIKTKQPCDFQSRSVVKKPLDVQKNNLENAESSYLNCPESKVNILDADGSNAIYDGAFSGENNFQTWLDGKKDIGRESNSVSKFKEEIIDVDEEKKLRSRSKNSQGSKGAVLKIATRESKIKILKNSYFSCTDSLHTPLESLVTSVDLNNGQVKPTNSQLLRISLLKAGAVSNMSIRSENNPSSTSFKDMKEMEDFEDFIG